MLSGLVHDDVLDTVVERVGPFAASVRAPSDAVLVLIAGERIGRTQLLNDRAVELGRAAGAGMAIDIDSVSRRHARIEWNGQVHTIADLGSTNGTFVNQVRVTQPHPLADGDRVLVGKALFKYLVGSNVEAAYHRELEQLARFDGLTGAANRRYFDQRLKDALLRAEGHAPALVLFDIDHFKRVNDSFGHACGDAVLCHVAGIANLAVGTQGLLARIGGEEFAVLLEDSTATQAHTLAENIRERIEQSKYLGQGQPLPVTVSAGVSQASAEDTPSRWFQRADERLYEAKRSGRNCVR